MTALSKTRTRDDTVKQELCLAYHILAHLGLDDHTYTHLSMRAPEGDSFYIYPFGLRFEEVQPDVLLRISLEGDILEGHELHYNQTGYITHKALYAARPDVQAIFHLHTPASVAVSTTQDGLLPLSQWALHFYRRVRYHDYDALLLSDAQGEAMVRDMGQEHVLFMRHHGFITTGRTAAEALFYTYHLEQACKTQCLAKGMNAPLRYLQEDVCAKANEVLLAFEKDLGRRDWHAWQRVLGHKINSQ